MVLRGTYCLCIYVTADIEVKVGALGLLPFHRGRYIYIGSALNSLAPRINRHKKISRGQHQVTHWHIDYLLREPVVEIESIHYTEAAERKECFLASEVAKHGTAVKGFGCSDCKCESHLYGVDDCGFVEKLGLKKWDADIFPAS